MKQLKQPEVSITVSKTRKDRIADAGKMVLANYSVVLEKQATMPLNFVQVFAGAVLCLGVGAVFSASYAKSAGFYFALATGIFIGMAMTLIYVTWKASKHGRTN